MTKTEQLTKKANEIFEKHYQEIKNLETSGPRGGRNARGIPGWTLSPNGTVSKACNDSCMPTMSYWSGSAPTPSTAVPTCAYADLESAYKKIFEK